MHFLFIILIALPAWGFMNIESLRQNLTKGFAGASTLRMNGAQGNTEKILGNFETLNTYVNRRNEYIGIIDYAYGEATSIKDTYNGSLHLRYAHYLWDETAIETFTQFEFDEFTALELRRLFGLGLRFRFYNSKERILSLGTGAFYENESIDPLVDINQEAVRANIRLVRLFFMKGLKSQQK